MKILIVDDAAVNLYILEMLLKGNNYEVVSAGDGVEAIERLHEGAVDLIISDILMPRMDGFQLCRECKSDPQLRKIPFVFYTATYTEARDQAFAMSLGADRFVIKPIDSAELLKIVDEVITHAQPEGTAMPFRQVDTEQTYLREYNERLVSKLEKKMLELQELNRTLQENEARINKNYVAQRVINSLFHLSQGELPLQGILEKAVDLILTLPWLALESTGCIHLVEGEPDVLVMKAQKGMEVPVRETCARLPFGKCLCGMAARTREVQFAGGG